MRDPMRRSGLCGPDRFDRTTVSRRACRIPAPSLRLGAAWAPRGPGQTLPRPSGPPYPRAQFDIRSARTAPTGG